MKTINFHLTDACNYNCAYCFGKFPDTKELTLAQACAVVDNIARFFAKNGITDGRINLAGGEPLLYKHLDGLIDYICAYNINVSIITNGSLLTKGKIASWRGKVNCIGLSIDSVSPEANLAIGRCCHNKTLTLKQAISLTQAVHRNGIKLKINTVVSKLNVNDDMRELYKRLKPDRLKLLQMEIVNGINDAASKYAISKKAFDGFCKKHKPCSRDTVCESSDSMENSYLMINPQGEFLINNGGKYQILGNCLVKELSDIVKGAPLDKVKISARYGEESGAGLADKKIVIFGGHPTWGNGMKKQLSNAQIILNDNLHSLDVIRNADEIWIQNVAISHSFSRKILDTARLYDVPVHYFQFIGVNKCIEEIG